MVVTDCHRSLNEAEPNRGVGPIVVPQESSLLDTSFFPEQSKASQQQLETKVRIEEVIHYGEADAKQSAFRAFLRNGITSVVGTAATAGAIVGARQLGVELDQALFVSGAAVLGSMTALGVVAGLLESSSSPEDGKAWGVLVATTLGLGAAAVGSGITWAGAGVVVAGVSAGIYSLYRIGKTLYDVAKRVHSPDAKQELLSLLGQLESTTSSREAETIAEALTKFISSTEGVSERIEAAHGVRLASQFIDDPSTRFGVLKKLLMSKEFQEIRLEKIGGFIFTDAVESLLFIDSQSERSEGLRMLDLIAPSYLPDFSQGERQVLSERLFEMKEAFPTGEIQKRLSRMALDIAPQESLIRSNIEEVLLSEAESMSYEDLKEIFDSGLGERDFRRSLKSLLVKSAA